MGALFIALAMMVAFDSRVAEADPPDFCERLKESLFERGCCIEESRNCESLRAAWEKRDCPIGDPCYVGCGAIACLAYLGDECCNPSCGTCAPPDVVCPAEICE